MYKVRNRTDGSIYTVYAVSGLYFMMWNASEKHWEWAPMENFEPVEEMQT